MYMLFYNTLSDHFIWYLLLIFRLIKSSAAETYPLRGLTCSEMLFCMSL